MGLFPNKPSTEPLEPACPTDEQPPEPSRGELIMASEPQSAIAEQVRRLRNAVIALNPERAARSVLITSAVRGEGKSVATINLGMAIAELPRLRVLVVDGDMRNPSIEDYLGMPRRQGFTEMLTGSLSLDQAIRRSAVEDLDIIGAGVLPEKPAEILNADRIRTVLNALKQRYDYVLLDSPPAMAINDASIFGALTDGIILVVRLGLAMKHQVEETQHLLENLGGNVLGTCVTGSAEANQAYAPY